MNSAEFMDLIICSGGLAAELIAGDIQNFKSLIVIVFVQLFNRGILGSKAAASRRIDDEDDFSLIICQIQIFAFSCFQSKIINHLNSPLF